MLQQLSSSNPALPVKQPLLKLQRSAGGKTSFEPSGEAICDRLQLVRIQVYGERGQSHFANDLHITPSTYNYYEHGRVPPIKIIDRICKLFNLSLVWFIRGEPSDFQIESIESRIDRIPPRKHPVQSIKASATPAQPKTRYPVSDDAE